MNLPNPVYFDHNATTPLDPRVLEAMMPWLSNQHGNPSSIHQFGQTARSALDHARRQVSGLLGGAAQEIVFAGSGTEANNAVLLSRLQAVVPTQGSQDQTLAIPHFVVSAMEHPSILETLESERYGSAEVTQVAPGLDGLIDPQHVADSLQPNTRLVSVMLANNELGTLQPIAEIAGHCREAGVPVLCDAVQAVGKIEVKVKDLGVDYLTLGGHKFHGPLGASALWVNPDVELTSFLTGGSQERSRRASTENLPAIVGLGQACEVAGGELGERQRHLLALRDRFESGVEDFGGAIVHCQGSPRLPHTSHVAFSGVPAHDLMIRLDLEGFAVSTGAACASGVVEPSRTLLAMGLSEEEALASLRVSFGMTNTMDEVNRFLPILKACVDSLKNPSSPVASLRSSSGGGR